MFTNQFLVKHFDINGDFIEVINPGIIKNEISFSAQKNGGQGQLSLVLNLGFTYSNFIHGEYIKVYVINEYHPSGYLLYGGYIQDITYSYDGQEQVELSIYGLASLMTNIYYKSGANLEFTQTDDPADIIKDVIAGHNIIYPGILGEGEIDNYGTAITYNVSKMTGFDVVKNVSTLSEDFYWYVDQDGLITFTEKPAVSHRFTYGRDIDQLTNSKDGQIYNKLYLYYDGGNQTYTDPASIALYGTREIVITDTSIDNITTADSFAASYFTDNANPVSQVDFTIDMLYEAQSEHPFWDDTRSWDDDDIWGESTIGSYEIIRPGQVVKIQNIDTAIIGQVEKIIYGIGKMQVSLNKFDNFIQLIQN